jgi:hypothetical protein
MFFMDDMKALALAGTINWDVIGHRVYDNILPALTGDEQFVDSENERDQCFHARRILRMGRTPTVLYSVTDRLLSLDKGLVER